LKEEEEILFVPLKEGRRKKKEGKINYYTKGKVMEKNLILEKSYRFALKIVQLYKYLTGEKHEYILSKKLLNSGTEIGAQVKAAQESGFREEFIRRNQNAYMEGGRTEFRLQLLLEGGFLEEEKYQVANEDCVELKRILSSILKTAKANQL
jgi:four helix bundle protein